MHSALYTSIPVRATDTGSLFLKNAFGFLYLAFVETLIAAQEMLLYCLGAI